MEAFKRYLLRQDSLETGSGSKEIPRTKDETIVTAKKGEEALAKNSLSERVYNLQSGLKNLGKASIVSGMHADDTVISLQNILSSGNNKDILSLQKLVNQQLMSAAQIPEDGVAGSPTQDALKKYYNIDISLSIQKPGKDSLKQENKSVIDYNNPNITGPNLSDIKVEKGEALLLAREVIPGLKNQSSIKAQKDLIADYQKNHNISEDGMIGKETYLEMRALEAGKQALKNIDTAGIHTNTQGDILLIVKNGNLAGKNVVGVFSMLEDFKEKHEKDSDWNTRYKSFFDQIYKIGKNYTESPAGEKAKAKADANSQSYLAIIEDPNLSMPEKIEKIAKDPVTLMVGGILFLFGVFGSESNYTNAWWKRFGILLGLSVFGEAAWNKLGGPELKKRTIEGLSGEQAQKAYTDAKGKVEENLQSVVDNIKPGLSQSFGTSVTDTYNKVISGFTTKNEELKTKSPEKYIKDTTFVALNSALWADEAFLNTEKIKLSSIGTQADLNAYISPETQKKLSEAKVSDADIKKYISQYVTSSLKESDAFVRDALLSEDIKNTLKQFTSSVSDSFSEAIYSGNSKLNTLIKTDISNLLLHADASPTQKLAAQKLAEAVARKNLSTFKISEYPNLTSSEKGKIEALLKKIFFTEMQEKYIEGQVEEIGKIQLTFSNTSEENEGTLTSKMEQLLKIQKGFSLASPEDMQKYDIDASFLSLGLFEDAFAAKKKEILTAALTIAGFTYMTIDGQRIDIQSEKIKMGSDSLIGEKIKTLEDALLSRETLPSRESSPLTLANYYKKQSPLFEQAREFTKDITTPSPGSKEAKLQSLAQEVGEIEKKFKDIYSSVRVHYSKKSEELKGEIAAVEVIANINEQNYITQRNTLTALAEKSELLYSEVMMEYSLVKGVAQILNKIVNGTVSLDPLGNSLDYLDNAIGGQNGKIEVENISALLKGKIVALETAFITKVPSDKIETLGVSDIGSLSAYISALTSKEQVISQFTSEEIKTQKLDELKTQVSGLAGLYMGTLERETDFLKSSQIYESYISQVQGKLASYLILSPNAVENLYREKEKSKEKTLFLLRKVEEETIDTLLEKSGAYGFFETYAGVPEIKEIDDSIDRKITSLGEIISAFASMKSYPNLPEVGKTEIDSILTSIEKSVSAGASRY